VLTVLTLAWLGGAAEGRAQGTSERLLLLTPRPDSGVELRYVLEFADEARQRLNTRYRHRMTIVSSADICKLLTESAFPCDVILEPADAERLARAMQADVYFLGRMWSDGAVPTARFRMVDIGRSGVSGWLSIRGAAGDPPRRMAEVLVDSLGNQIGAAERARECSDRRDRGDFRGAMETARRVLEVYPNHPAAAQCAAVVAEAMQLPVDTQIAYLERAVRGDSLSDRTWQRLGQLFQVKGDSIRALDAFRRQVILNPFDRQLWRGIIAGYITVKQFQGAMELADQWLSHNPNDLEFLQLKTRACFEGELWACAVESLGDQYDLDSTLANDSTFYQQILAAAQASQDTHAVLRWATRGARRFPDNQAFWLARGGTLAALAQARTVNGSGATEAAAAYRDSAIAAFDRVLQMNPEDVTTAFRVAQMLLDRVVIDTIAPLDTASLYRAGEYLDLVTAVSQDTAILMNSALMYFRPAQQLVQARREIPLAVNWLEKAIQNDVMHRLSQQANFFLGWGLLLEVFRVAGVLQPYIERYQALNASSRGEACALVTEQADYVRRGVEALRIGGSLSPQATQQFMQNYTAAERNIPQYRQAFQCG
jgi:tetratricopeptide (TPR) repeat protein